MFIKYIFVIGADFPYISFLGYGDNYNQWVPQVVKLSQELGQGSFVGIDHTTFFGASEFFQRSYLFTYSPYFFFGAWLFGPFDQWQAFAFLFSYIFFVNGLGIFSLLRIASSYLKLSRPVAIFLVFNYFFGVISTRGLDFVNFHTLAASFPLGLWVRLQWADTPTQRHLLSVVLVYTLIFLGGYIPFALLMITLIEATAFLWRLQGRSIKIWDYLWKELRPFFIACGLVLPLYLSYFLYVWKIAQVVRFGIEHTAFEKVLTSQTLPMLLSSSIKTASVYFDHEPVWGASNIFVLMFGLIFLFYFPMQRLRRNIFVFCLTVYAFFYLVSWGRLTPLAGMFYHLPGIGYMHYYQRYLLFVSLYFYSALALLLDNSLLLKRRGPWGFAWIGIFIFSVSIVYIVDLYGWTTSESQYLKLRWEYYATALAIAPLVFFPQKRWAIAAFVIVTSIFQLKFYGNTYGTDWYGLRSRQESALSLKPQFEFELSEKIKSLGKKDLYKFINFGRKYPHNFLSPNLPWLMPGFLPLSGIHGYEMILSTPKEFRHMDYHSYVFSEMDQGDLTENFGESSWFGRSDVDFLILEKNQKLPRNSFFNQFDQRLPFNEKIELATKSSGLNMRCTGLFCGKCKESQQNVHLNMVRFTSEHIQYQFNSDCNDATLIYQQWPHRNLQFFVDQQEIQPELVDGFLVVKIPQGSGVIEAIYKNNLLKFAVIWVEALFLIIFLGFLGLIFRSWWKMESLDSGVPALE